MKTKMTAIFAILMITLMAVGFAYAHWEKIITINGTITTGKLHLYPTFSASTNDLKGICTVTWKIDGNTLTVEILKAYPCITVTGKFDLHNDGTIPAGLNSWTLTIFSVTYNIYPDVIKPSMTEAEVKAALETWVNTQAGGAVTVTVDFHGSNFWQIHPGEEPYLDFTIHFEEDLLQDKTFKFTMELEYYNWNEAASTK